MPQCMVSIDQLRDMIGVLVSHEGVQCQVLEVLEDGPTLILMCVEGDTMQPDQFGNPSRRVPETHVVPVMNHDGTTFHPSFLALNLFVS